MNSMNSDLQKGRLKRWNDDKGFGFITSGDGGGDIFIHISALKRMGRHPAVGDVIIYQVHLDNDGIQRAVNAKVEGIAQVKSRSVRKSIKKQSKNNWFSKVLPIILMTLLGFIAYNKLVRSEYQENSTTSNLSYTEERDTNRKNYSCEGKVYCSEMTSCEEAEFYLRNCPDTKMDGDGDGVPCESQWCGRG